MTIETEFPAVKVLPLKWSDDPVPEAESEVGRYSIYIFYAHVELGIDAGSMSISRDRIQLAKGATLDDLKAAAQADYDRRIISALTLKDDPGNGASMERACEDRGET